MDRMTRLRRVSKSLHGIFRRVRLSASRKTRTRLTTTGSGRVGPTARSMATRSWLRPESTRRRSARDPLLTATSGSFRAFNSQSNGYAGLAGSHSSIGLPSGSCSLANRPLGYFSGSTFTSMLDFCSCATMASKLRTRKFTIHACFCDPK
jgi:hypothetical protein